MRRARFVVASLLAAACGAVGAFACGEAGSWHWWGLAGGRDFTSLPGARFRDELARVAPATITDTRDGSESRAGSSAAADAADVVEALVVSGTSRSAAHGVAARVVRWRGAVERYARDVVLWRAGRSTARPRLRHADVPRGLSDEFAIYLRGHLAWADGDARSARRAWSEVLVLPEVERHWRSTWAAYRLGRSWVGEDAERASREFTRCRDLAGDGFADTDGLARASLGWEARAWFLAGDSVRAMRLYLVQREAGVDTTRSLVAVGRAAVAGDAQQLGTLAADAVCRRAFTAFLLSQHDPYFGSWVPEAFPPRWLAAVESAGAPADEADRLAWLAYTAGQFDVAERWVARAAPGSPGAAWIASKVRLREGRLDDAAALLAESLRLSQGREPDAPADAPPDALADEAACEAPLEQGIVDLCRARYVESLDLLLRERYFEDAAYVAERVLTTDELCGYVDRRFPGHGAADAPPRADSVEDVAWSPDRMRFVLARRLVREGRRGDARPYFPSNLRSVLDRYDAALRTAEDRAQADDVRASAYRDAARLAHDRGADLIATENEPDFAGWVVDNWCRDNDRVEGRSEKGLPPRPDERARYAASAPPDGRAVLTALRLAHEAAALLPDEEDATAAWLSEAASWIPKEESRYAESDDAERARLREELVTRCGKTSLGREVADTGRFPWEPAPPPAPAPDPSPAEPDDPSAR